MATPFFRHARRRDSQPRHAGLLLPRGYGLMVDPFAGCLRINSLA
jgi:hypothetical protein